MKKIACLTLGLALCFALGCGKKEEPKPTPTTGTPAVEEPIVEPADDVATGLEPNKNKQNPIQKQDDPKPAPKPNIQKQDNVDVVQGEEP